PLAMVKMGAVRTHDLVCPRAVAQIAAAFGAGDQDLNLGRALILAALEIGQNCISSMYHFLIGRHTAAIGSVPCLNGGKVASVILFLPNCGTPHHVRLVSSCCRDHGEHSAKRQNQSTADNSLRIHVSSSSKRKRILKDWLGKGKTEDSRSSLSRRTISDSSTIETDSSRNQ